MPPELVVSTVRVPGEPRLVADVCGDGELVVLLHGIGGNRSNWARQLRVLAPRCRAVAYDARGYGESDDGPVPLSMADFSSDLGRVLDYFGAARAHVIGLSMGGMVAMDYCLRAPVRVASLVLADTGRGPAHEFSAAELEEFLRLRRAPLLAGKTPRDTAPAVARSLVAANAAPAVVRELEASLAALRRDAYLETLAVVTRYAGLVDLQRITAPTLVLVGSEDRVTPVARVRELAALIPRSTFAVIERAGHLSNLEQPQAFNRQITDFLLPLLGGQTHAQ
ncbi:MAG TPA: alpha/beta fold hydrolase [Steroidobacteraceae bacterium]|nr:alpha/beta fold hydrolase [Steroidobacteraceae bacterium]